MKKPIRMAEFLEFMDRASKVNFWISGPEVSFALKISPHQWRDFLCRARAKGIEFARRGQGNHCEFLMIGKGNS